MNGKKSLLWSFCVALDPNGVVPLVLDEVNNAFGNPQDVIYHLQILGNNECSVTGRLEGLYIPTSIKAASIGGGSVGEFGVPPNGFMEVWVKNLRGVDCSASPISGAYDPKPPTVVIECWSC